MWHTGCTLSARSLASSTWTRTTPSLGQRQRSCEREICMQAVCRASRNASVPANRAAFACLPLCAPAALATWKRSGTNTRERRSLRVRQRPSARKEFSSRRAKVHCCSRCFLNCLMPVEWTKWSVPSCSSELESAKLPGQRPSAPRVRAHEKPLVHSSPPRFVANLPPRNQLGRVSLFGWLQINLGWFSRGTSRPASTLQARPSPPESSRASADPWALWATLCLRWRKFASSTSFDGSLCTQIQGAHQSQQAH